MRILIVGRLFGLGGAERSLMPLARELAQQGNELTLLLLRPPKNPAFFTQFPGRVMTATGRLSGLPQLSSAIGQADQVIVTSELTPTYITWLLCQWHRKPLIADVQVYLSRWIADSCHPIHHTLCRWVYPRISKIRCVAAGVAADLQTNYQVPASQLSVIYVPFDLAAIAAAAQQPIAPEHEAIFQRPTIVAAGRFTSQKRFDLAIAAFAQLRHEYQLDTNLLILGDGELRSQLEQQIATLELGDRVFLPGLVENPHAYVSRAQAFLLTSDYEGLPRVLIEALAVGCPIVATNCPSGPAEILADGKWGLLTPMGDATAIAAALAQILTQPEFAQHLRQHGPQRAQAFDTAAIAQQYQVLLQPA